MRLDDFLATIEPLHSTCHFRVEVQQISSGRSTMVCLYLPNRLGNLKFVDCTYIDDDERALDHADLITLLDLIEKSASAQAAKKEREARAAAAKKRKAEKAMAAFLDGTGRCPQCDGQGYITRKRRVRDIDGSYYSISDDDPCPTCCPDHSRSDMWFERGDIDANEKARIDEITRDRHRNTNYDELLFQGYSKEEARSIKQVKS